MAEFPISGLRSVDIDVPDLAAAAAFYTDIWGLSVAERSQCTVWLRGTGAEPYLLGLHASSRAAIRSMAFRVANHADPETLVTGMVTRGAASLGPPKAAEEPGGGLVVAVRDAQGRTIRLVQGDATAEPLVLDLDRPERLAHVNFNSDNVSRDVAFYTEALGFRLTDRSRKMAFVRTNSDHHSIVIAESPGNTLNHIAFQMPDWESVMRASGRMIDHSFPIGWGPGRHGPGNNVFAYFVDPFGFVIEYTADVLQVDDDYCVGMPEDWVWPQGRTDQWGIAPPKTRECAIAQLAIPFAGDPLGETT